MKWPIYCQKKPNFTLFAIRLRPLLETDLLTAINTADSTVECRLLLQVQTLASSADSCINRRLFDV